MYVKGKYFQIGTAKNTENESENGCRMAVLHEEYLSRIRSRFEEEGLGNDAFVDTTLKSLLDSVYAEAQSSKRKYFQWKRQRILLGAVITAANGIAVFSQNQWWWILALLASVCLTGGLAWQEMKKYDENWMQSSFYYSSLIEMILDYLELNQGADAEKRLKEQVLAIVKRKNAEFYKNVPEAHDEKRI